MSMTVLAYVGVRRTCCSTVAARRNGRPLMSIRVDAGSWQARKLLVMILMRDGSCRAKCRVSSALTLMVAIGCLSRVNGEASVLLLGLTLTTGLLAVVMSWATAVTTDGLARKPRLRLRWLF